jgi:hypothetical protein
MQCVLRYTAENEKVIAYEVTSEVRSVQSLFSLLRKLHEDQNVVLYMGDLALYGDGFRADLEHLAGQRVTVISTARSNEWSDHFARYLGNLCTPFVFERFGREDYAGLIDRLDRFVPAPAFKKLTAPEKIAKLAQSHDQLLIALRETTESQNFDEIITAEYEKRCQDRLGFAMHALADLQLRMAIKRDNFDTVTRNLIDAAAETLLKQDARNADEFDQYPMVTLARGHLGALIKHGQIETAKRVATRYFDRLQQLERQTPSSIVKKTKERVFRFVTLGEWDRIQ